MRPSLERDRPDEDEAEMWYGVGELDDELDVKTSVVQRPQVDGRGRGGKVGGPRARTSEVLDVDAVRNERDRAVRTAARGEGRRADHYLVRLS